MAGDQQFYDRLVTYAELAERDMATPPGAPPGMNIPTLELALGMKWAQDRIRNLEQGHDITAGALRTAMDKLVAIQEILVSVTNSSSPEKWVDALENISGVIDD